MNRLHIRHRYTMPALLTLVLALTAALYWQGLHGAYLFDDFSNFVDNDSVHVNTLAWRDWQRAALASPAHDLPRPLAMLSYAFNYYLTGLDPWPMKLTNLLLHLFNGVLLYAVLRRLLELWNRGRPQPRAEAVIARAALLLACAWLVCPINVSPVLYVVQRMESLAQIFVLGGLLFYLHGRRLMLDRGTGAPWCAAGLVLGTGLGLLCKETAVMLPVYTFLIELTLLRFASARADGRRKLWAIYIVLLIVPGIIGMAWLLPRSLSPGAYAGRPFTLPERLFTELRIVVDYMQWTLLPRPDALGFYHDNIALSDGWLSPPSTLACALLIAALMASAVVLRRRLPLYALGIGWFFAAQSLTGTIIALELVFEHRNYFASIGLLLAVAGLLLEIPSSLGLARRALVLVGLSLFCAVTWVRTQEWGNPIRFAYAEALEHPDSPRANYELGRTLAIASGYRADSSLIDPAMQAFERAAALPDSDGASAAGLIMVANHAHRQIRPEWWQNLTEKLTRRPPSQEDVGALDSLAICQRKAECAEQTAQLLSAYLAALNHPAPVARLLAGYGAFVANQLGDYKLAAGVLRDAVTASPDNSGYRIELAKVLALDGQAGESLRILQQLDPAALDAVELRQVDILRTQLQAAPTPAGPS